MFRYFICLLALLSSAALCEAKTFSDMFGRVRYSVPDIQATLESLNYQEGTILLGDVQASLTTTSSYYYLDAEDSAKITKYIWHLPDNVNQHILGMFQTASFSPVDAETWYSAIRYEPGYVSRSVITEIDTDSALKTLTSRVANYSVSSSQANQSTRIVGWATRPKYSPENNSLYWAVEAESGDGTKRKRQLFHYLCLFGRSGTLYLFINSEKSKSLGAQAAISNFINQVKFYHGQTYLDHVEGDPLASSGVLGLTSARSTQLRSSLFGAIQGWEDLITRLAVLCMAVGSTMIVLTFKAWIRQTLAFRRFG